MKSLLFALTTIVVVPVLARLSDGKVVFHQEAKNWIGKPASGFHFNKDAPAQLRFGSSEKNPIKKEEQEMVFDLSSVTEGSSFHVSFYVCDDKKTVCEEHNYDYTLKAGKVQNGAAAATAKTAPAGKAEASKATAEKKSAKLHYNHHGFIENDIEGALQLAKKQKKRLLVDYGAPWCPACVRLETEVFGTKEFKKATASLIKVALNADMMTNKSFGEKYEIKALPTLLVLDQEGHELHRSLDFKPAKILAQELRTAQKNQELVTDLEKKAQGGDKAAQARMAEVAFNKMDFETAVKWYEKLPEKKNDPFYAYSEISVWQEKNESDAKNRDGYVQVLKKWIAAMPDSFTAISARNDWADLFKNEKELPADVKTELEKNKTRLASLAGDEAATTKLFQEWKVSDIKPFEKEEILSQWLKTVKALKQDEETKQVTALLQESLKAKKFDTVRAGEIMTAQQYWREAGMKAEEEQWLKKLTQAYPDSYVYHMRLARFYMRNKDYALALPEAEKAVELGADLRIHNLQMLAQIQKELNQREQARKSIERALALPEAKLDRYKSVAQSLEELKKSL